MHVMRAAVVLFLILAVLIAYNPRARETVMNTWENIRPALVALMDNVYAVIRDIITSNGSNNGTHETPVPAGPGVNFQHIITLRSGFHSS